MNIKTKIVGAFAIIIAASLLSFSNLNHKKNGALTPVAIVELFSSDGCNSCPPAGDNLNDIIRDAANNKRKIYCLDFHVDYKNNGGWVDPFSSKAFTERQNEYTTKFNLDKAYTPQMVVNGVKQFNGTDKQKLDEDILNALLIPPTVVIDLTAAIEIDDNNHKKLTAIYKVRGDYAGCFIHLALVERDLQTKIKGGENKGKTLLHHNIVHEFITRDIEISTNGVITIPLTKIRKFANCQVIAYVQAKQGMAVIGATAANIEE